MPYLYVMEAMINLILQFGDLNKQQIDFLLSKVEMLEFKKDDYLSEAGKVPRFFTRLDIQTNKTIDFYQGFMV